MRFPSKVTSFNESIIGKFPIILKELSNQDLSPNNLYRNVKNKVKNLTEFIEILVCLFALSEIQFVEGDILHYVKKY